MSKSVWNAAVIYDTTRYDEFDACLKMTNSKLKRLLQFDSSKWASWQYVKEGMSSYQTTFQFGSVWNGYTNVDSRRMLPDVDPSAWMRRAASRLALPCTSSFSFFVTGWKQDVTYSITSLYAPSTAFLLATTSVDATKKWKCSFFVVVESKPNWSQIAIVIVVIVIAA